MLFIKYILFEKVFLKICFKFFSVYRVRLSWFNPGYKRANPSSRGLKSRATSAHRSVQECSAQTRRIGSGHDRQ